ncbi:extensin-like [Cornus florida]|uniref:extensin-like n=1 Tax=Cornus florida TaxID=4283 RepID=UPI00289727A4|nr:extensin-like [Cornus florida]
MMKKPTHQQTEPSVNNPIPNQLEPPFNPPHQPHDTSHQPPCSAQKPSPRRINTHRVLSPKPHPPNLITEVYPPPIPPSHNGTPHSHFPAPTTNPISSPDHQIERLQEQLEWSEENLGRSMDMHYEKNKIISELRAEVEKLLSEKSHQHPSTNTSPPTINTTTAPVGQQQAIPIITSTRSPPPAHAHLVPANSTTTMPPTAAGAHPPLVDPGSNFKLNFEF